MSYKFIRDSLYELRDEITYDIEQTQSKLVDYQDELKEIQLTIIELEENRDDWSSSDE